MKILLFYSITILYKKTEGFTLVELVVVIAILSVLGTIAFITLQGYAREARNSSRASDIATARSALSFYSTENSHFPLPDNYEEISYSGVVLWRQGVFSNGVRSKLGRISKNIIDPSLGTELDYSVQARGSGYQLATNYELASVELPGVERTYALSNTDFINYIEGTYDSFDLNAQTGSTCSLITIPSLIVSEVPVGGVLALGDQYKFSYDEGPNLAKQSYGAVDITSIGAPFTIEKVYDKCSVDVVSDIDLYIAKLSTAYQQYADSRVFENIVFTSDTKAFRARMSVLLLENAIEVSPVLLGLLKSPIPDNVFTDIFNGINGTDIGTHMTTLGLWGVESGTASSYEISGNTLVKTDNSASSFYSIPSPAITSSGSTVSFDINNFGGGNIYSYLRYSDVNNYYAVEVNTSGYKLIRMQGGVSTDIQDIAEAIVAPINISFSSKVDNLTLKIGNIEKENLNITGVDGVGKPVLYFENTGAAIDNYTLTYQ